MTWRCCDVLSTLVALVSEASVGARSLPSNVRRNKISTTAKRPKNAGNNTVLDYIYMKKV